MKFNDLKNKDELTSKLRQGIEPCVNEAGLQLYKLELVFENEVNILRVTVDKDSDVDIDEVTKATELINAYLDEVDPIDTEYSLEVTSRGIEKELSLEELKDYVKEYLFIKTPEQELYATLLEVNGADLVLKDRKNKKIKINMNDVVFVRTAIKF